MINDRIVNIVQDHANIVQCLDQITCALENDALDFPNFIPVLHDTLVTDQLGKIIETLRQIRNFRG